MSQPPRILVARTDRLGDVILSLPCLEYLRATFPEAEIDFLARPELEGVLRPYLLSRSVRFLALGPEPRLVGYDAALFLHELPAVLWAGRRIPIRVGPLSRLRSFFLLNHGNRQRRSRAEKN
jgi:hypothetical protein